MASTFTSLGFELQGTGDNTNTWGVVLNLVLTLVDEAIRGRVQLSLSGTTYTLDATNGDVRKVQRFARHASSATTIAYDDKRADHATVVAHLVGGA